MQERNLIMSNDGYKWVNKTIYNGLTKETLSEEAVHESILVPDFQGIPTGRVIVSGHVTKNLGNFESARIGVEMSLPTLPTEEELVRVYDNLQQIVSELIDQQLTATDVVQVVK